MAASMAHRLAGLHCLHAKAPPKCSRLFPGNERSLSMSLSRPFLRMRGGVVSVRAARKGFLTELNDIRQERDAGLCGLEIKSRMSKEGEMPDLFLSVFLAVAITDYPSPLKIVLYPDPILRRKNKKINVFDERLKQLASEMLDIMYK